MAQYIAYGPLKNQLDVILDAADAQSNKGKKTEEDSQRLDQLKMMFQRHLDAE
eukprot:evm.model.scf_476.1 EVM.evm.TU.scf_476.1   scf_476:3532-3687(-)